MHGTERWTDRQTDRFCAMRNAASQRWDRTIHVSPRLSDTHDICFPMQTSKFTVSDILCTTAILKLN